MTKQKQRIVAIAIIGVLLCIVSLLALHVGTISDSYRWGRAKYFKWVWAIPVHFTVADYS